MKPRFHFGEIDALKGLAILGVLAIHAQLFEGTFAWSALIDRSVPILVILFGATSELSWRARADAPASATVREYWRSRLVRLMPPIWVAVGLWWIMVYSLNRELPGWPWPLVHALGYMPQIGTSWFITLIVQLVLIVPVLHFALHRAPVLTFAIAFAVMVWGHLHALDVIDSMRTLLLDSAQANGFFAFYYFWIFMPIRIFPVLAGMSLARRDMRLPRSGVLGCAVFLIAGMVVQRTLIADNMVRNALAALLDVPLTIVLLELLRAGCPQRVADVLGWLGRGSWSVYLGQLVVHNTLHPIFKDALARSQGARVLYFASLLAGGLLWVAVDRGLRRRRERPDARGDAAPPPLEGLGSSSAAARARNG